MSRKTDLITHIRIHMNLVEGASPSVIADRTTGYHRRTIAQLEAELAELREQLAAKRQAEKPAIELTEHQNELLVLWHGAIARLAREKSDLRSATRRGFSEAFLRDHRNNVRQARREEERAMADFRATLLPEGVGRDFIEVSA